MDCLPKAAGALTDQIDSAKAEMDGLIGDATSEVSSLIAGATADIETKQAELVPEIELPQANLQDEMSDMLKNKDDPGAFATKFKEIKDKFVGLDLDTVLDEMGLDAEAMNRIDQDLAGAIEKVGTYTNDALNKVMGGRLELTKDGLSIADISTEICKKVPNIDLDAAGEQIKKGLPAELPTIDAEKIEAAIKIKTDGIVPEDSKVQDLNLNISITVSKVET